MRYFMFIDESGDANIVKPDTRFDTFVLCGILFREDHYNSFNESMKELKKSIFNDTGIIFHSFEMRYKTGKFGIFKKPEILSNFYNQIGKIFTESKYIIIACIIDKDKYRAKYSSKNHAYEDSISFLCERAISCIGKNNKQNTLHLCLEKRNKDKDIAIKRHYTSLVKYGTQYICTDDFKMCNPLLHFRGKNENINGLQFADLCAYPIGRKFLSPDKSQPTFDLIENKFYCNYKGEYKGMGLKTFP